MSDRASEGTQPVVSACTWPMRTGSPTACEAKVCSGPRYSAIRGTIHTCSTPQPSASSRPSASSIQVSSRPIRPRTGRHQVARDNDRTMNNVILWHEL